MPLAFVTAPLLGDGLDRLRGVAEVVVGTLTHGVQGPEFKERAGEWDAVVTRGSDRVDDALLATAARVKVIAQVAVGVDNIDLAACRARGVLVTNTPGVLSDGTADLAFGLMLAAARRIGEGERLIRGREPTEWGPLLLIGKRVSGARLGIVGMGRIGQAMARRARGFGMHVAYSQRNRLAPEMERALGATFLEVDELFAQSDFVSLHCPLTPETRHVVNAARLAKMPGGSVLVNTARGGCVDEEALLTALHDGPLAAAALDVFRDEPNVDPRFLALPNVVLTPHIASADATTRRAMTAMAVDNAIAVLEGREPPNRIA